MEATEKYVGLKEEEEAEEREAQLERAAEFGLEPQGFQPDGGPQFGKPQPPMPPQPGQPGAQQ